MLSGGTQKYRGREALKRKWTETRLKGQISIKDDWGWNKMRI